MLATRSADSKVVDVKLSLEECKYYGNSTVHRVRDGDQWVPDIQMPIIGSVRNNTTVSLAPQRMTLVGAAAALKGDGMVDPSKRVLHFIQVK